MRPRRDERLFSRARSALKRIRVSPSSDHVVVRHDGQVLADSRNPLVLSELGLPRRYYLPAQDVRLDLLEPSPTLTTCAYKGQAQHYARGGRDIAWTYRDPLRDVAAIKDLVAFYNERVDIEIDGEPPQRPRSPFS
jgi:uncharacterized protein (DUF427 family)